MTTLYSRMTEVSDEEGAAIPNVWMPGDRLDVVEIRPGCPSLTCCEVMLTFREPLVSDKLLYGWIYYDRLIDPPPIKEER